jgi:hypothetical protein
MRSSRSWLPGGSRWSARSQRLTRRWPFSAKYLVKAQSGYRLLNALKIVLPILTVVLLGAGVWVARGHRRALIGAALGFAASMLVLGAGLAIFRSVYLASVPPSVLPADAAAVLYDDLIRFIKDGLRLLLVVGLIIAIAAFFAGPSAAAVSTRRAFSSALGRVRARGERAGLRAGPAGRWTYSHRTVLRVTAVAIAALVFVFWSPLPGWSPWSSPCCCCWYSASSSWSPGRRPNHKRSASTAVAEPKAAPWPDSWPVPAAALPDPVTHPA